MTTNTEQSMTGIVEKVEFTQDGLGNQWTTIEGIRYFTLWDIRTRDWMESDKVTFVSGQRKLWEGSATRLMAWDIAKCVVEQQAIPAVQPYQLPAGRLHENWTSYQSYGFAPDARQKMVMDACIVALGQGCFYTDEVYLNVVKQLNIDEATLTINTNNTERGNVGMDIYYARNAVREAIRWDVIAKADAAMKPVVGLDLGTLCVAYKRTTNCVIASITGSSIVVSGKRGTSTVTFTGNAEILNLASVDAVKKNWRKQSIF